MGKGIGFPQMPYKLDDLSKIERTFYDVDPKYLGMIAELSQPIVMVCADIADQAGIELDCSLNPNLPFTLADHIQFAAERLKKVWTCHTELLMIFAIYILEKQLWQIWH